MAGTARDAAKVERLATIAKNMADMDKQVAAQRKATRTKRQAKRLDEKYFWHDIV